MQKTTLIVLFNLKAGVSVSEYEAFARDRDVPTVSALKSVDSFTVYRSSGLLGSDLKPPFAYVEMIEVNHLDGLFAELQTEIMTEIAGIFQSYADQPIFMLTDKFAG
jgi:hypothetical protein